MSHFYAGVKGARGPATRCGSKGSGMSAYAKSWNTQVNVVYTHRYNGKNYVDIFATDLRTNKSRMLYSGPEEYMVDGLKAATATALTQAGESTP